MNTYTLIGLNAEEMPELVVEDNTESRARFAIGVVLSNLEHILKPIAEHIGIPTESAKESAITQIMTEVDSGSIVTVGKPPPALGLPPLLDKTLVVSSNKHHPEFAAKAISARDAWRMLQGLKPSDEISNGVTLH